MNNFTISHVSHFLTNRCTLKGEAVDRSVQMVHYEQDVFLIN